MQTVRMALYLQLMVIGLMSVAFVCFDARMALAVLCGGLVPVFGQLYLLLKLFFKSSTTNPQAVVLNFYRGVVGRFVLMAVIFALLLMSRHFSVAGLLIGLIMSLVVAAFNPMWLRQYRRVRRVYE